MKFLVSALPRSGTTWIANWLSALHEPLYRHTPEEVIAMDIGVCCTGLWLSSLYYDCPRVIIERPIDEVNDSLRKIGLPSMPEWIVSKFSTLPGPRFQFKEVWTEIGARAIWATVRSDEFDVQRYEELRSYNVQPEFRRWKPDQDIMKQFMASIPK